jgi:hypothetical protein
VCDSETIGGFRTVLGPAVHKASRRVLGGDQSASSGIRDAASPHQIGPHIRSTISSIPVRCIQSGPAIGAITKYERCSLGRAVWCASGASAGKHHTKRASTDGRAGDRYPRAFCTARPTVRARATAEGEGTREVRASGLSRSCLTSTPRGERRVFRRDHT